MLFCDMYGEVQEMVTKQDLVEAGTEKLADMLLDICRVYNKSRSIRPHLNVLFSTLKNKPQEVVAAIENEFAALDDIIGDYTYMEFNKRLTGIYHCKHFTRMEYFVTYLQRLRGYIINQLAPLSANEGVKLMRRFIELYGRFVHHESIGENRAICSTFGAACKDMLELHKKAGSSLEEITEFIMGRITDEYETRMSCAFYYVVSDYKEILGSEGLYLLQQKLEKVLNDQNRSEVADDLRKIADLRNDVDAYIKACALKGQEARDNVEIAKRLVEHARLDEALRFLELADSNKCERVHHDVISMKVTIFDKLGKHEEAQMLRIEMLENCPSTHIYDTILQNYNGQMYAEKVVEKALSYRDVHDGLWFLLSIENMQTISKMLRSRLCDVSGTRCEKLAYVANALKGCDPLGASLLYRKMIDSILKGHVRCPHIFEDGVPCYYATAVDFLITCEKLSSKIIDWEQHKHHKVYRTLLKKKFKNRKRFWSKFKLELADLDVKREA